MAEWHLAPEYIIDNWTDEKLDLMIEKLTERKTRESQPSVASSGDSGGHRIPASLLFAQASNLVKVVKKSQ